jgi:hypothetical protein
MPEIVNKKALTIGTIKCEIREGLVFIVRLERSEIWGKMFKNNSAGYEFNVLQYKYYT